MAASAHPSLNALLQKATLEDHQELLKASNVALKKSKTDLEAQQVKVVALLKLDQYDEAAYFFEESGAPLKEKAALEYAYSLYKVGKLEEACQISSNIKGKRGAQHVEAQSRYRSEDFSHTASLYKNLSANRLSDEDFDLRVNQGAVNAQAHWQGTDDSVTAKKVSREDLEAFETAYNAACGSIARGELGQAEVLLRRAKELCKHSEDLTAEQKEDELLPICVQQLYVLQRLGKTTEAEDIASEIKVDLISDLSTRKIAQSNLLLSPARLSNPFLAHSRFHSTPKIPESDKLFSFQSRGLIKNEKAIDLQAFKFDGVAASTAKDLLKYPSPSISPETLLLGALNAAAHARNEVGSSALKRVLPELEKRPNDVGLILTIVQLYTTTGNSTAAIHLLESFFQRLDGSISENDQDVRFSPGLISLIVGLYRIQGRKSHIKQELAKAASYWRHKSKAPTVLLHVAGASLLDSSDPENVLVAKDIFTKLHEQNPDDKAAAAGFVASHATDAPDKIESDVSKLTPVSDLIRDVDVDALERNGIPQPSNALTIAQQLGKSRKRPAAPAGTSGTKSKRIRKSRLPKEYDPSKTPDPDRWLPLRDRSTYRPKGKKKGKKNAGDDRTQGGVVADDVGVNGTAATAMPVITATGGAGGAANKKKKGKGKK